ncbi:homoserine kinase [Campylobacter canadensis]|uniref:Homoserine kinase n=1 Tax=Campylobacter canadensis TaxID=449520 RepID=A0ABS7WTC6_9BACT|nr:homoserine kinase [Campylobacter canadensis]MBZ7987189.1 homoserine kinase [Campylobacter canadensis]MBZ7994459.1 homoserine kinase [Campylobacter canadensis]MBZ7996454.1 homoserine kinase [Campylobacter canadensis]MBZ7998187.1 homoserine kinase [Campylobacter canadensis]MBZ7999826.1 homoserine kinase [Campylobacter canadensis]
MQSLKVICPATSANLGPGFDCLGLALDLHNEIVIKKSAYFSVKIKGEGEDKIQLKKHNLFTNIFCDYYFYLSNQKDNFSFDFINNIPLSRGLGSSSSVIIAALVAASAFAKMQISKSRILSKALEYESHPDNISPALLGGFVSSLLVQDGVKYLKTNISDEVKAVVCIPDTPISTEQSRKALAKSLKFSDACFNIAHSSLLSAAFFSKNYEMLRYASFDKLHQKNRMKNLPILFEVQKTALENKALMSTLSGSGSSFFNLCYADDAEYLFQALSNKFTNMRVLKLNYDNLGARIC